MTERTYGKKYNPELKVKDIAKLVKKEIKEKYKNIKVSARTRNYSSIDINVELPKEQYKAVDEDDLTKGAIYYDVEMRARREGKTIPEFLKDRNILNKEAKAIEKDIDAMLLAYNYDGSDIMTDYFDKNFYGFVNIELV